MSRQAAVIQEQIPGLFEPGGIIMRNGQTAVIRPSRTEDWPLVEAFFASRRQAGRPHSDLCDSSDPKKRFTLIALLNRPESGRIIAFAAYDKQDIYTAKVAFRADHAFGKEGLESELLKRLSAVAARQGLKRFGAVIDLNNHKAIETFRNSGYPIREEPKNGYLEIDLDLRGVGPC